MIFFTPYWVSGTRRKSNFLLCEARNPTMAQPPRLPLFKFPQSPFVNSACFGFTVSSYVGYFGYVMFIQSLLLIGVDNFWLNWSRTKKRLQDFVDCIEAVNNNAVKRADLARSLHPIDEAVDRRDADAPQEGDEEEPDEGDPLKAIDGEVEMRMSEGGKGRGRETLQMALSKLVAVVNPLKKAETEDALRLNENLRAFIQVSLSL